MHTLQIQMGNPIMELQPLAPWFQQAVWPNMGEYYEAARAASLWNDQPTSVCSLLFSISAPILYE